MTHEDIKYEQACILYNLGKGLETGCPLGLPWARGMSPLSARPLLRAPCQPSSEQPGSSTARLVPPAAVAQPGCASSLPLCCLRGWVLGVGAAREVDFGFCQKPPILSSQSERTLVVRCLASRSEVALRRLTSGCGITNALSGTVTAAVRLCPAHPASHLLKSSK